jgi:hypothetical protein
MLLIQTPVSICLQGRQELLQVVFQSLIQLRRAQVDLRLHMERSTVGGVVRLVFCVDWLLIIGLVIDCTAAEARLASPFTLRPSLPAAVSDALSLEETSAAVGAPKISEKQ